MNVMVILVVFGALGTILKGLLKGLEDIELKVQVYPGNNIIKIGQNTEKNLGEWRKLAVTQTPVENNQLTLV